MNFAKIDEILFRELLNLEITFFSKYRTLIHNINHDYCWVVSKFSSCEIVRNLSKGLQICFVFFANFTIEIQNVMQTMFRRKYELWNFAKNNWNFDFAKFCWSVCYVRIKILRKKFCSWQISWLRYNCRIPHNRRQKFFG